MVVSYLGVGSNLGNRQKNIKLAIKRIDALKGTKVIKTSCVIETYPVGGPRGQGKFLNAALKIKTNLSVINLLKELKQIEKELGRARTVRWGPRVIDLDILFYADKVIKTKNLTIPHPRILGRDFVIKTLAQVL